MKWMLLLLLTANAYSQVKPELFQDEEKYENLSLEEVRAKKDVTLRDEAIISDTNPNTGIKDYDHYTGKDHHRLTGSYSLNPRITKLADFSSFEIGYGYKMWGLWWNGFVAKSAATWSVIGENKDPNGTSASSEGRFQRPRNTRESLFSYGAGVGYRFKMIYEWIHLDDLFESINVYAVRHTLGESYRDLSYQGWGMRADYAIHKRATSSFIYGLRGSYNIAKVTRALDDFESHSEGSLALSWVSLGFEVGYAY